MAERDIQKLNRQAGQTWEQAFEGVDKTSKKFQELVAEFVEFVGDWKEFSDLRRDRLQEYIEDLDGVQENWEKINDWISQNSDTLDTYTGSLSDIRSIFQSISAEVGGFRRQTLDSVNVVRNLSRLANDNLVAIRQEGGLTENVVVSLRKKSTRLKEEYAARLKMLGVSDLDQAAELRLARKREENQKSYIARELKNLEQAKAEGRRVDSGQLRYLKQQLEYRTLNLEMLNETNIAAVKGLNDQIVRQEELFREQRRAGKEAGPNAVSANKVNLAAKALKRVGLGEESNELLRKYGERTTRRVAAKQSRESAEKFVLSQQSKVKPLQDDAKKAKDQLDRFNSINQKPLEDLQQKKLGVDADLAQNIKFIEDHDFDRKANRYRNNKTGKFVDEESIDRAYNKIGELDKESKNLAKSISLILNLQKQYKDEAEGSDRAVKAANAAVKAAAEDLKKAKKEEKDVFSEPFNLLQQIKASLGDITGALRTIAGILAVAMWRQLLKFDEEAVKTKRVIGQWADASALANTKFVTGTEVLKTMQNLGEQFHINPVQVFSSEELGRIAQAQKLTGMSAEAAGNLGVQSKIIGKNADTYRDSIAAGANQANRLNHSAVTLSAVQNDVLNTSRAITLSYGKNVEGLAKAAGSAAALGMNLQQVEDISKNLMNFESSIQAEMQAQLLTGMQLNLAKAREYALNNDLNGVAQEISRQGMDAAKFSHMNYIQQENMAKALGMSREQLSKTLIMQEINKDLTAEQVAAMTGMRKEDIEALSAQEKWQTMKQRFLESLVPLLEPILQLTTDILIPVTRFVLGPISWLAGLISRIGNSIGENNTVVRGIIGLLTIAIPYIIVKAVRGVNVLGKAFGGIAKLGKKIGTSIASWATGIGKAEGAGGKLKALFSGLRPARDYQGRTARQRLRDIRNLRRGGSVSPVPAGATGVSRVGKVFSSLGKNIGKIAIGAAAMGIMSLALIGIAKALQMLQGVEWKQFGIMAASIGLLAGTMIGLGAIMMSGVGAALLGGGMLALGMLAVGMIAVGAALDSLGKGLRSLPAGTELTSISGGIRAIAGSVGELAVKLKDLQPRKLRALGKAFKNLKGAGIQIQTPIQETEEVVSQVSKAPENTGESKEIKRETIETAAQSIVIKQAQVQASAQQISVEQKATDLSKIEQKIDSVIKAVVESRPDWKWLEFKIASNTNS